MGAFDGAEGAARQARAQATLRLNLSVGTPNDRVFWKPDGNRFSGKSKAATNPQDWLKLCSGTTLKLCSGTSYQLSISSNRPVQIRGGSGRWRVIEVDGAGRQVEVPVPLQGPLGSMVWSSASLAPSAVAAAAHPTPADSTTNLRDPLASQSDAYAAAASNAPLLQLPTSSSSAYLPPSSVPYGAPGGAPASSSSSWALPPAGGGGGFTASSYGNAAGSAAAEPPPPLHSPPPLPPFGSDAHFSPSQGPAVVDASSDPHSLNWSDDTPEDVRSNKSVYRTVLPCRLPPSPVGSRQYLLVELFVEEFGSIVCPLQIKVYPQGDKGALTSFRLRFIQYDFREDSSGRGDLFAINFYQW